MKNNNNQVFFYSYFNFTYRIGLFLNLHIENYMFLPPKI